MNTPEPRSTLRRTPVQISDGTPVQPTPELPTVDEVFAERQSSEPTAPNTLAIHSVVQVFNPTSPFYGVLFQIGDMQQGKVHGFQMMAGGKRAYVTVGLEECWLIGTSKTRSKNPVSPQWEQENKKV